MGFEHPADSPEKQAVSNTGDAQSDALSPDQARKLKVVRELMQTLESLPLTEAERLSALLFVTQGKLMSDDLLRKIAAIRGIKL